MDKIKSTFIRKRGNNYNVIIEYRDENEKIKQKSVGKYTNKKDAEKHLIDLKSSINNNSYIISKDITLVERCTLYAHDESKDFSPTTSDTHERTISKNIEPFFKDIKLAEVTPSILQGYANYVYSKYSQDSARRRLSFVKAVLNEAYRLREIQENPCNFIKTPKSLVGQVRISDVYNKSEVKEIIEKIEGHYLEIPILLMLSLGLRSSEACGLKWQDVDFENNTISVNQILVRAKRKGLIFKSPKTSGSIRTISVPKELMTKLKKIKIKHNEIKLQGLISEKYEDVVCLNKVLNAFSHEALIHAWYRFCDKNNIRKLCLHDLRHTHATLLLLSNTNMKVVSQRLGHTDIRITMNRYSHVLEEMDTQASENISNIIFN